MKRFFSLILIVALMLCSLASCSKVSGPKDLDNVTDAGKIVVGMECAYAPYNWTTSTPSDTTVPIANSQGSYADGYDVQIARMIADELGVELVIMAIEWDGLIPALEAGEIDIT